MGLCLLDFVSILRSLINILELHAFVRHRLLVRIIRSLRLLNSRRPEVRGQRVSRRGAASRVGVSLEGRALKISERRVPHPRLTASRTPTQSLPHARRAHRGSKASEWLVLRRSKLTISQVLRVRGRNAAVCSCMPCARRENQRDGLKLAAEAVARERAGSA